MFNSLTLCGLHGSVPAHPLGQRQSPHIQPSACEIKHHRQRKACVRREVCVIGGLSQTPYRQVWDNQSPAPRKGNPAISFPRTPLPAMLDLLRSHEIMFLWEEWYQQQHFRCNIDILWTTFKPQSILAHPLPVPLPGPEFTPLYIPEATEHIWRAPTALFAFFGKATLYPAGPVPSR